MGDQQRLQRSQHLMAVPKYQLGLPICVAQLLPHSPPLPLETPVSKAYMSKLRRTAMGSEMRQFRTLTTAYRGLRLRVLLLQIPWRWQDRRLAETPQYQYLRRNQRESMPVRDMIEVSFVVFLSLLIRS